MHARYVSSNVTNWVSKSDKLPLIATNKLNERSVAHTLNAFKMASRVWKREKLMCVWLARTEKSAQVWTVNFLEYLAHSNSIWL